MDCDDADDNGEGDGVTSIGNSANTTFNSSFSTIGDEFEMTDSDYDPDESMNMSLSEAEDDDDDDDDEEDENYRLESCDNPAEEKYCIVSETALFILLSICRFCCGPCTPILNYAKGSMISVITTCLNGHTFKWDSQAMHKKIPIFNLMFSSAILISGNNISKVVRLFRHMIVRSPSSRTISRLQALYTVPSGHTEYERQQSAILHSLREKPCVVLGGDGRCDSPGYSAKYCCYTLMDLVSNKIAGVQMIQRNEVQGSTHMELEGLKRGLAHLTQFGGINVRDLVTDRHVMIKSFMKQSRPDLHHYFDVWHIAKGVSKKLEAATKKRGGEEIRPWIKGIVNHCFMLLPNTRMFSRRLMHGSPSATTSLTSTPTSLKLSHSVTMVN